MLFNIHRVDITESTNDDAKAAAAKGAAAGTVFWALQQKSGRGRLGRVWHSPVGNLYFSVVLRPALEKRAWVFYSFAVALAIAEGLRGLVPPGSLALKWPNDVLVNGGKISGLLLESGEDWLIAGIGLNIAVTPENALYPAASLADFGTPLPLETVLNNVLQALAHWEDILNTKGFAPLRGTWLALARKGAMRVRAPNGTEYSGIFADLDDQGNLCLSQDDGSIKKFNAGDVFF